MNTNNNFDDILNECLDRIIKGETVESCLKIHPGQAEELRPLLLTAQSAKVASTIKPGDAFKARARTEFQAALRDMQAKKPKQSAGFSWRWRWQSAWSISLATLAVLIITGGGMVFASRNSLPDDALYSLKLASENFQLAITPSDIGKAELNAKFADRRVDEIIEMTSTGGAQGVLAAANNLSVNMSNMANLAGEGVSVAVNDSTAMSARNEPASSAGGGPALMYSPQNKGADNITQSSVPVNEPDSAPVPSSTQENTAGIYFPPIVNQDNLTQTTVQSEATTDVDGRKSDNFQPNSMNFSGSANPKIDELAKIREIITTGYLARQARLEEALNNASPELKPIILQAINQSTLEYDQALANNDLALNSQ
jgi:hypothetical protein